MDVGVRAQSPSLRVHRSRRRRRGHHRDRPRPPGRRPLAASLDGQPRPSDRRGLGDGADEHAQTGQGAEALPFTATGARRARRGPRRVTLYVDSSALLKRYIQEPDSDRVDELLSSDSDLVTARHTVVEVRRNLVRQLTPAEATAARASFSAELAHVSIVELDAATCELAATSQSRPVRALDALHSAPLGGWAPGCRFSPSTCGRPRPLDARLQSARLMTAASGSSTRSMSSVDRIDANSTS